MRLSKDSNQVRALVEADGVWETGIQANNSLVTALSHIFEHPYNSVASEILKEHHYSSEEEL